MKRTKILCTIGPASENQQILSKMIKNGMNAARLNFSHGTYENHKKLINNIRKAAKQNGVDIAIIQDLQGPRIRCGKLPEGGVKLQKGKQYIFTTNKKYKDNYKGSRIFVTYQNLHKDIKKGDEILIRDGLIKVKVLSKKGYDINVKVLIGGVIESNKGMNFPDTKLNISPITKKDIKDLEFGISQDVDWVALSFVSVAEDIKNLRRKIITIEKKLNKKQKYPIKIIPKIEKAEAIKNIDEIIQVSDGIMIARGDLGIELPPQKVPVLQKEIIMKCREAAKPVVVATQMLESMIENPRPTRAEVSDIANAVIDHTDVVMLSGETANGKYPVEAVKIMAETIQKVEESVYDDIDYSEILDHDIDNVEDSIGLLAGVMASTDKIKAVFVASLSGRSGSIISSFRAEVPIFMGTVDRRVGRQVSLNWGIRTCTLPKTNNSNLLISKGINCIKKSGVVKRGDMVLCIVGEPVGEKGGMNLVKIMKI